MLVFPSPKSQLQLDTFPVDLSLNVTVKGNTPDVLLGVNAALSGAVDVKPDE